MPELADVYATHGVPDYKPRSPKTSDGTPRIERLANTLATAMQRRINSMADSLNSESKRPPFAVELTEDEQLQQWAAMDEGKWTQMATVYGVDETRKYSEAMIKLFEKKFGPANTGVAVVQDQALNSAPPGSTLDQNGQQVAQAPEQTQSVDSIIQDAMKSVGG